MISSRPGDGERLARAATPEEAERILKNVGDVEPLISIDQETELGRRERLSHLQMKERYGRWLLNGLATQIVIVDVIFVLYAAVGVHWRISAVVMDAWLGATVVQVVGIVLVVVHHLFPAPRD